jgi:hypothetical protein
MLYIALFAGLTYFYPKATAEWIFATILAGVAAWLTVETHGIAPLGRFELWFIVYYIIIQLGFGLRNRKV